MTASTKKRQAMLPKGRARVMNHRVQRALSLTREQQQRLDQVIAAQRAAEQRGRVESPLSEAKRIRRTADDPWRRGKAAWPLGDARQLIRDGYSKAHTIRRTGWGEGWFSDLQEVR